MSDRSPELPRERLPHAFYQRSPRRVARDLLGMALVHRGEDGVCSGGWIVETEAYLSQRDPASHSHRGRTRRNQSMFAAAGTLYVYSIHAKACLNVVTETTGRGSAVLIRGLQPVWGVDAMQQRRGWPHADVRLSGGPARLCQALAITTADDGRDLVTNSDLWIARPQVPHRFRIKTGPRIGISSATRLPLRYFVDGNTFVSGRRGDHSQPATGWL
ncbi:DNA-3-methyladenine glycosylase [Roseimaritima sediminicola]|uniref:DNA-3-methyladenine glycosylase n=1 Tax=Roseimaritima sediminicola TaxID=2662066 RepID=UPI001EEE2B6D|nr:DNA-3-methyladenine glycosylase [Roseimaritima sediminicola]